jgi:hypothetical protein
MLSVEFKSEQWNCFLNLGYKTTKPLDVTISLSTSPQKVMEVKRAQICGLWWSTHQTSTSNVAVSEVIDIVSLFY